HRTCDVLIIDDIQFLSGKEKSQDEVLHTINALCEKHQQIIITADNKPTEIKNIKQKLQSKLTSGLILQIINPEFKARIKIIEIKGKFLEIKLKKQVSTFIAKKFNTNIREIESVIKYIITKTSLSKNTLTLSNIKKLLEKDTYNKKITIGKIITSVINFYNLDLNMLISKKRNKSIVTARQIIFYLCKNLTKNSLSEIGNALGKYKHTTVLYSYKKINALINNNNQITKDINNIKKSILE
ncbi:MAG: DnaA/Hda family protein, partial [Enterobacteriaceae bacterium]|nr:DnaA/Hda family protein [Enterobacteriaceae bacterium]